MKSIRINNHLAKNMIYGIVSVVLVIGMVIAIAMTVKSESRVSDLEMDLYYQEKEENFETELRNYLDESGFTNAGMMVTYVADSDGNRLYTVKLNHYKFDRLDEGELGAIRNDIAGYEFVDELCSFRICFL